MKIVFIVGTRPELIKLAPVINKFINEKYIIEILNTAQHKDLLNPYWDTFGLKPTAELDVMKEGQSLAELTAAVIVGIQNYLDSLQFKPNFIMAQGDTTTVMATSMVSFFNKIKFLHLEAGLRSWDLENPFPEEYNRRIASIVASHHFCPTDISKMNLLGEGVTEESISVVGNTVIDSLNLVRKQFSFDSPIFKNNELNSIKSYDKIVLITCHRRENHGDNLIEIIEAINKLIFNYPNICFVWTIHPNPNVKNKVLSNLKMADNIKLLAPLDYIDLLKLLSICNCVISDSGGIQEEAPSFSVPVLILRDVTERPEAVNAGISFLVGANQQRIISTFDFVINSEMDIKENPYGDGTSSDRIFEIIQNTLKFQ
jgi:UDP-N-acetylglucosamine 2-epimerase (non-hydrolysing)